jgi:hypothetical protein
MPSETTMPAEGEIELKNTLRALQAAVEGLGRAQKKTSDEVARFGSVAQQAYQKPKTDAEKLEEAAKKTGKAWRETGQAIAKVGGPLGEIVARFGGGFGMGEGLSRIAAAAAVAGIAFKAFNAVLERQAEDAREATEAWRKMGDAIDAAKEKSKGLATGALGQAGDRRRVRAVGGEEGIEQMDALTAGGIVGAGEASGGIAAIYGRFGRTSRARAAINTARALAQTGVPFEQAAQGLVKAGGDLTAPGAARRVAGRIFNEHYGRRGGGADGFDQALADTGGDVFLRKAAEATGVRSRIDAVGRSKVEAGLATTAAKGDLAAANDPTTAAVMQVYQTHLREIEVLERIAASQSDIALNWADIKNNLGIGKGSEDRQALRKQRQFEAGTRDISYGSGD